MCQAEFCVLYTLTHFIQQSHREVPWLSPFTESRLRQKLHNFSEETQVMDPKFLNKVV